MDRSCLAHPLVMCAVLGMVLAASAAVAQEVIVMSSIDELVTWLQGENWWGEEKRGEQLQVPHVIITGISHRWRQNAQEMTVPQKKEIFYRLLLPLIVHANDMVLDRRVKLEHAKQTLVSGKPLAAVEVDALRRAAVLLRILDEAAAAELGGSSDAMLQVIDEALYRLDVIPAGLVLGQAAYESGYGTSRFAAEGNALFGQWSYGGKGLVPGQQREQLGDHRIAAFDWPFDSVRAYFLNLSSHPAYEDFRRLRADLKAAGRPVTSMALADGLVRYSERGQEYVDTLKSILRVNGLAIADGAVFRDEPTRFIVGAENDADAEEIRREIGAMRTSGELAEIVDRMRLE